MATQIDLEHIKRIINNGRDMLLFPSDFRDFFLPNGKQLTFKECNAIEIDKLFKLTGEYGFGVDTSLCGHSFSEDPELTEALFVYLWYMAHETYANKVSYDWPFYLTSTVHASIPRTTITERPEKESREFKTLFESFLNNMSEVCAPVPEDKVMNWLYEGKMSAKGFANTSLKEKVFGLIYATLQRELNDFSFFTDLFTDNEQVLATIVYVPA